MKTTDEKERNELVDKIVKLLSGLGYHGNPQSISEFLEKEKEVSGIKSEVDYQREQSEWLEAIKKRKK